MKQWLRTHTTHFLVGLALLVLPILYFINEGTDLSRLEHRNHEIQNLLSYVGLILFSYANHTRFVPRYYLTKRYVRYVVVVVGGILGVVLIPQRVEQWVFLRPPSEPTPAGWARQLLWAENMPPPRPPRENDGPPQFGRSEPPPILLFTKFGIIFLLCSVSALASITAQANARLQRIENEKLDAELLQLKAQIHPHFLFNTLNSIYALAIRRDDRTAETIVKLSDFMRYMIRDAHHNSVPLERETNYIRNYIDLQRARLQDSVRIDYVLDGDVGGKQIAPLLLFTFIENAFKYGVNPDDDSTIRINLIVNSDMLHLHVFNHKVRTSVVEASHGIGLSNARERLRLLYPAAHQLAIDDAPNRFTVDLTLTLV